MRSKHNEPFSNPHPTSADAELLKASSLKQVDDKLHGLTLNYH